MKIISLQSGSNGNCICVEAGGARLLIDAGISGKRAEQRMADSGRDIRDVDAILISHDHGDHIACAGIYQRKFKLPIYITEPTLTATQIHRPIGRVDDIRYFQAGDAIKFNGVTVETIPTPHDSNDSVAFVIDDGRNRLGVLTDLGHVFSGLGELIGTLDAVIIESNYDPDMLDMSPYPQFLKQRISGPHGHLSNAESAKLLAGSVGGKLKWACLGHLSGENNDPSQAIETHRRIVGRSLPLFIAGRYEAAEPIELI
ncbi:MAG: MBL fold metallo-hydrolase [Phycisphaerae bacterium]|jgi:phosphoribosyl 1,2-cyclic phosphodiesterase|nr:MBL fold metallo-hydrolase [Phycisphaerae bacterium]